MSEMVWDQETQFDCAPQRPTPMERIAADEEVASALTCGARRPKAHAPYRCTLEAGHAARGARHIACSETSVLAVWEVES